MLAAVESFTGRIHAGKGIGGFHSIIPVETALGRGGPHQPIAAEESTVTKKGTNAPVVNIFHSAGQELLYFFIARLHAEHESVLLFWRELLEIEGLARPDTDAGECGPDLFLFRRWWNELEREREIAEEIFLNALTGGREEIDLRRGRRRGLLEKRGKRLPFVSSLHLLHIRHILRIEELSAIDDE